jgi:hypothetical protein
MTEQAFATEQYRAAPSVVPASSIERLHVERRCSLDLDEADARLLDGMIEGRPNVGVFLTQAWLAGFFAEPPVATELSVLLFRQGSTLRGLVPIAVRRGRTHVCVSLIGADRIRSCRPAGCRGFEALAADAFPGWLGEEFGSRGFLLELRMCRRRRRSGARFSGLASNAPCGSRYSRRKSTRCLSAAVRP